VATVVPPVTGAFEGVGDGATAGRREPTTCWTVCSTVPTGSEGTGLGSVTGAAGSRSASAQATPVPRRQSASAPPEITAARAASGRAVIGLPPDVRGIAAFNDRRVEK
jgi:hypothetical protein